MTTSWEPYGSTLAYVGPHRNLHLPLWRELRRIEMRGPLPTPPAGRGRPVLLAPGLFSDDARSMPQLGRWLAGAGWDVHLSGFVRRPTCAEEQAEAVASRVAALAARSGPVAIVGHSRGGQVAKVVAMRDPASVAAVVGLGSPLLAPYPAHPLILLLTVLRRGVSRCPTDTCCLAFNDAVLAPYEVDVPYTSIYTRGDGAIDWRTCLDPAAEQVEVSGTHLGLTRSPEAWAAVGDALASLA